MFDNVIGHQAIVAALGRDLEAGNLPQAILLHGPRWTGKMTLALELSRVAACQNSGAWRCACESCARHRLLADPYAIVVASAHNLSAEIPAALDAWVRDGSLGSRYLAFRSLQLLARRFDPALIEHRKPRDRTQRLGETLAELLEDLDPGGAIGNAKDAGSPAQSESERRTLATSLRDTALSLLGEPDLATPGVDVIRGIRGFLQSVPRQATVILEDAELLQDSARNAILKILEEPPADVRIVLTSTRPHALIPTIRSRVRPYALGQRSADTEADVLRRVFRVGTEAADAITAEARPGGQGSLLAKHFTAALGIDSAVITDAVAQALSQPGRASALLPAALTETGGGKEPFSLILLELERAITLRAAASGPTPADDSLLGLCERERFGVHVLNIPESLALERIGVELELGLAGSNGPKSAGK